MRFLGTATLPVLLVALANVASADDFWRVSPSEVYGPDTYCNWNRTGLPQAQQDICLRRDRAAETTQAHASSRLAAFERGHTAFMKMFAQASAAAQCKLRSDEWFETFKTAYAMGAEADIKTFRLTDAEIAAANLEGEKVFKETISRIRCSDLVNSPGMKKLDKIQWKLTGGYH